MATKKKLLQAAAGSAGGAGGLNVEQVFSTYLYEGNGGFQTIQNNVGVGSGGNGDSAGFRPSNSDDTDELSLGSANYITSGDFTIEGYFFIIQAGVNSANSEFPTLFSFNSPRLSLWYRLESGGDRSNQYFRGYDTTYRQGTTDQHPEETYTNTWVHIAMVRSSGTITLYVNGTSAFSWSNTTDYSGADLGIGNDGNSTALQGYVSNFRVVDGTAVYTSNFTPPTENLTAISGTTLLTCVGSNPLTDSSGNSHSITVTGTVAAETFGPFDAADAGEGGLVWIKGRTGSVSHALYDTERGANSLSLSSDDTGAAVEVSGYDFSSFNSNGFTVSARGGALHNFTNDSGREFASWTFRKAPKFFDVVTYTGDGTAGRTISHNLGTTVGSIFIKRTDASGWGWVVYHRQLNGGTSPEDYYIQLHDTAAEGLDTSLFNSTAPTDSVFSVGSGGKVNASGGTYVAYLFAHNDGDGDFGPDGDADIIKCGSYTTSSGQTTEIDLGFEPQFLLRKRVDSTGNWAIQDTMRGWGPFDPSSYEFNYLLPNTNGAEGTSYGGIPTSTGFTNYAVGTYIYIAIRRGPMAVPESATDVFDVKTYTEVITSGTTLNSGFVTDTVLQTRNSEALGSFLTPRLTENYLQTSSTSVESANDLFWDRNNGVGINNFFNNTVNATDVIHMWKRAPSFFDVVAYTGNNTAGRTVSHNLGVAPEMMWVKGRDVVDEWHIYHSGIDRDGDGLPETDYAIFNTSPPADSVTIWNDTAPTDSVFTLGNNGGVNGSGSNYIAYLFASLDGVSKVGSFTGTGSALNIDCGFSNGARFVLIKRYDITGHSWLVYDSARGIVSGNDPYLELDTTDSEVTGTDLIDPYSAGFSIPSGTYFTTSGASYIFYAIA